MIALEQHSLGSYRARKLPDGFGARCRNADHKIGVDDFTRGWERILKSLDLKRNRMAVLRSKSRC